MEPAKSILAPFVWIRLRAWGIQKGVMKMRGFEVDRFRLWTHEHLPPSTEEPLGLTGQIVEMTLNIADKLPDILAPLSILEG